MEANKSHTKEHIEFLFEGMDDYGDGSIEISILNQSEIFEYTEKDKAVNKALEWNNNGKNVYVIGSLLLPDLPPFGRSSDEDFYGTTSVWCDIDDDMDKEKLKFLYDHCPPNAAVVTATHPHRRVHLWWKLDECLTDSDTLREILRGISSTLGGDMASTNPARLMRVGGSVNRPNDKKRSMGRISELTTFHKIHDDKVSVDKLLTSYPLAHIEDFSQSVDIVRSTTQSSGLSILEEETVVDGRDKYMSDMLYASILNLTQDLGRWPTGQEVFDEAWPTYSSKAALRNGRTLDQDNRGSKVMQHKINSKLRNFISGRIRVFPTLESILKLKQPETIVERKEVIDPDTGEVFEIESKPFKITDWIASDKYQGEAKEIQWLVEGVFPLGVPCLMAAMGGLGKSFIALDMCVKIAMPKNVLVEPKVLGHNVLENGRAVFMTAEDSFNSIHRRINAIVTKEQLQSTKDNLLVIPMPEVDISQLLVREGREGLEMTPFFDELKAQLMAVDDLKLIVIDPLQAFVGADITSKPEAAQFMWSAFAKIASQTGATMLVTHHTRKDGSTSIKTAADARESIRGTTGLVDGCRVSYVMWQAVEGVGKKIAHHIGKDYSAGRFVQGAVVKNNDQADNSIMSFYREDNGILTSHGVINIDSVKSLKKLSATTLFIYESIVRACDRKGEKIIPYVGTPEVISISYEVLHQQLEIDGFKTFIGANDDEYDEKKMAGKVKNATSNARIALRKADKIGFSKGSIWLSAGTENAFDIDESV